jgi:hypothetical protein
VARPRQVACYYGHPFTEANTRLTVSGAQRCVACGRRHSRQYRIREQARRQNKRTIALIVWRKDPRRGSRDAFHACWTFHRSRTVAAAFAPRDSSPYSIIDITRKPWKTHPLLPKRVPR